jgi:hypothetical protein
MSLAFVMCILFMYKFHKIISKQWQWMLHIDPQQATGMGKHPFPYGGGGDLVSDAM